MEEIVGVKGQDLKLQQKWLQRKDKAHISLPFLSQKTEAKIPTATGTGGEIL